MAHAMDDPLQMATGRVAQIVEAAERSADELRRTAERRADERIAEADRAAAIRVQSADEEAAQVLAEAEEQARQIRAQAKAEAQQIVAEARGTCRETLRDGEELSGHIRELSTSLRSNAELLLRDIRLAHAEMTARLDRSAPQGTPTARDTRPAEDVRRFRNQPLPIPPDLDVPEFMPPS